MLQAPYAAYIGGARFRKRFQQEDRIMAEPTNVSASLAASLDQVRHSWGWFVALGVALVVLGIVCITGEVATTLISVIVLGWLLLLSGVMALVHAFRTRTWTGFFLYLLSAVLRVFVGYTLVRYPLIGALSLTLILAALFIVGGVFRAIGAASLRFPRWGWTAASGVIAVLLGLTLLAQLPASSLWFLGLAVGIDLLLEGTGLIALGSALRARSGSVAGATA
jgi:uncharacterized membrane protein HdeD (DUF308 family)